ncbi:Patellin-5 [Capsicum baccatum]|uniref:Patellin-5 n=1 Tax=Capsicum baccatum TaxID=33114 RepID=A0A2G2WKZ3_CAPBA|nr:Patellin-5 [Capsicum baccatum]
MAEETKKIAEETTPEVVVSETPKPEPENVQDTPEKVADVPVIGESKVEDEKEKGDLVGESNSFKEESNKVDELPNPEQKALAEFKELIQQALNKHEFTSPPLPPPAKEQVSAPAPIEAPEAEPVTKPATESVPVEESGPVTEKTEEKLIPSEKEENPAPAESAPSPPSKEKVEEKVEAVEEIKETIVEVPAVVAVEEPPAKEGEEPKTEENPPPPPPEEVAIWGIPLLADERSDVILLKFLRARDLKVKEAFTMLKNVIAWRKEFKIDELLDEKELGQGLEKKVVYNHGVDKEGHPVCYNAFGEFQDKELYHNTFADKEKLTKFLRWRIQFMEKSIRNLDFSPDGICTFVQVIDLKNSPGLFFFKKELRQATNRALVLLQDNYPEFVAKQVFINVPWWYPAYYRMINATFTTRTKSKFVFAGPSRSAETLFKYIAPEQVPAQYGGLSKEGEQEFTNAEPATEEIIKPASKHTIEFPVTEKCTLVWEARVTGWEVSYGAEFVPSAEGGYTILIEKSRKVGANESVISTSYKASEPGKVVIAFDNQTSKKKKLVYRSKNKLSDC